MVIYKRNYLVKLIEIIFYKKVPKFELLKSLISDTPTLINVDDCLTKEEICHLHRIISSSVEPFHRGDEIQTCDPSLRMSSRPEASWNRNKYVLVI